MNERPTNVSKGRRFEFWHEYPGTYTLAALWAIVYVAMVACQYAGWTPKPDPRSFAGMGPMGIGVVSGETGQIFGSWNSAQILSGQIWRAVTATFIHFNLIHIVLNVFGLIQLGRLIEEWYGPRLLFGLLILVGFTGNMIAALARPVVGTPNIYTLTTSSGDATADCKRRKRQARRFRDLRHRLDGANADALLLGERERRIAGFSRRNAFGKHEVERGRIG